MTPSSLRFWAQKLFTEIADLKSYVCYQKLQQNICKLTHASEFCSEGAFYRSISMVIEPFVTLTNQIEDS